MLFGEFNKFQFHKGTINTPSTHCISTDSDELKSGFQFHKGTINTSVYRL
jgi:hypothetical protein